MHTLEPQTLISMQKSSTFCWQCDFTDTERPFGDFISRRLSISSKQGVGGYSLYYKTLIDEVPVTQVPQSPALPERCPWILIDPSIK